MDVNEAVKIVSDPHCLPTYDELVKACLKFEINSKNMDNCLLWWAIIDKKEAPVFEIWNSDYLDLFSKYLASVKPKVIVEVGAGNGKLSHNLRQRLPEVKIVATDDASWNIEPVFAVENVEIVEALDKYCPDVVISSWMPYQHDWTPLFRACKSVKEYILIGETDSGCCGSEETWGYSENGTASYKQEGFIRKDLEELERLQVCRTDHLCFEYGRTYRHSGTVSFARKQHE